MTDRLRVGLIGAGRYAVDCLAPALQALDGVELAAFSDPDPQAARALAHGAAEIFADVRTLVAAGVVDAAVVATRPDALAPTALACLEAGLPTLVERPFALHRLDAERMTAAAQARDVVLMPGFALRFAEIRTRARSLLSRGVIGDRRAMLASAGGSRRDGREDDAVADAPTVAAVETIDQVLWLHGGRVAEALARHDAVNDLTVAIVTFADGVAATLTFAPASGPVFNSIEVIGDAGRVRSDWATGTMTVESATSHEFDVPTTLQLADVTAGSMYEAELREFVGAIRNARAPAAAGQDAVRALAVFEAIRESAERAERAEPVNIDDPLEDTTPQGPRSDAEARVRLQFTYSSDKIQSPFVYELSRRFHLKFDIRRADVDAGIGWVQLMLEGDRSEIDAAVQWAQQQGIRADPVEGDVFTE